MMATVPLDSPDPDRALARLGRCAARMEVEIVRLPLAEPFCIADRVFEDVETVVVQLEADGCVGQAEAAGVFYLGDMPLDIAAALTDARPIVAQGIDHAQVARLFPPGGARNALDCALWDLQAQRIGLPVWQLLDMPPPKPLLTTYTIGNAAPDVMADAARRHAQVQAIKIKLNGDAEDGDRIAAVRTARPDVWIGVDANRSLTPEKLARLLPALLSAQVQLVEQPFAVGADAALADVELPIALAADESVQTSDDLERLAPLYQVINIKLDKCGGLTDGLRLARRARALGLEVMVGNMLGSSLAMAPAFLLGQYCSIVDLDGPIFLAADCTPGAAYHAGRIDCAAHPWGSGQ